MPHDELRVPWWALGAWGIKTMESHGIPLPHFNMDPEPLQSPQSTVSWVLTPSASHPAVKEELALFTGRHFHVPTSLLARKFPLILGQIISSCCFYLLTPNLSSRIITISTFPAHFGDDHLILLNLLVLAQTSQILSVGPHQLHCYSCSFLSTYGQAPGCKFIGLLRISWWA